MNTIKIRSMEFSKNKPNYYLKLERKKQVYKELRKDDS